MLDLLAVISALILINAAISVFIYLKLNSKAVEVGLHNSSPYVPEYSRKGDACVDICANLEYPFTIQPNTRTLIKSGIKCDIPDGYEIQVRGRSGLRKKYGLIVPLGTIDSNYKGDIGVIIFNAGLAPYTFQPGEKIAQLALSKVEKIKWKKISSFSESDRGDKGFGSSGKFASITNSPNASIKQ